VSCCYLVAQITIHDAGEYQRYLDGFDVTLAPFDGKVVAVDEHPVVVEGAWPYPRTVVIRFASQAEARRWYDSAAYQRICQHRWRSASVNMVLVEGRE
jgi:uncharacterized protein (DUF1330 family)